MRKEMYIARNKALRSFASSKKGKSTLHNYTVFTLGFMAGWKAARSKKDE